MVKLRDIYNEVKLIPNSNKTYDFTITILASEIYGEEENEDSELDEDYYLTLLNENLIESILKKYTSSSSEEIEDYIIYCNDCCADEYTNITIKDLIDNFETWRKENNELNELYGKDHPQLNEPRSKKYKINYEYYKKLLDISNQYKTKYIKQVLDSIHNNQNDMATQRQYDLLKKFADGYGDNDKYPYSTKN